MVVGAGPILPLVVPVSTSGAVFDGASPHVFFDPFNRPNGARSTAMPMSLTVTRSRKRSRNYNSEGHGVSITVELDQALLRRPKQLRTQVERLYAEVESALDRHDAPPAEASSGRPAPRHNGGGAAQASATLAQRRAIESIAEHLGVDAAQACGEELGLDIDRLTVAQASHLIDHLKAMRSTEHSLGR